eukprot:scaffold13206_cov67-Phaeocystis_antarctica.AAC.3
MSVEQYTDELKGMHRIHRLNGGKGEQGAPYTDKPGWRVYGIEKKAHTCLDKRIEPLTQNLLALSRGHAVKQLAKLLLLLREG